MQLYPGTKINEDLSLFQWGYGGNWLNVTEARKKCIALKGTGLAKLGTDEEKIVAKKMTEPTSSLHFWFDGSSKMSSDGCAAMDKKLTATKYNNIPCSAQWSFVCENRC